MCGLVRETFKYSQHSSSKDMTTFTLGTNGATLHNQETLIGKHLWGSWRNGRDTTVKAWQAEARARFLTPTDEESK